MARMSRSRVSTLLTVAVLGMALLVSGCGGPSNGQSDATPSAPSSSEPSATPRATIPTEYDEKADARAEITAAIAASKADGMPVLLDFGADWCPDCRVLEKLYRDPAVSRGLLTRYHLVLVNVGEFDTNLDVAADYINLRTSGIPALTVIRDGRTVYASNRGQFANARSMKAPELAKFLRAWAA
jgi:thiol:disulfide interchange protein